MNDRMKFPFCLPFSKKKSIVAIDSHTCIYVYICIYTYIYMRFWFQFQSLNGSSAIDRYCDDIETLTGTLNTRLLTYGTKSHVIDAHNEYLDTSFRDFDAYLAGLNPDFFHNFVRLYPSEFETLHECFARRFFYANTHWVPMSSRQRLCTFLMYVYVFCMLLCTPDYYVFVFLIFVCHGTSFSHLTVSSLSANQPLRKWRIRWPER